MNQPATPAAPAFSIAQSTHPSGPYCGPDAISCPRCNGTGYLPQFRHVERGRCFRCGGARQLSTLRAA